MQAQALFIGLMSGTSLDGVDGVLADFSEPAHPSSVLASASRPFPTALRAELLALNTPGGNELHRAALAANALVRIYAEVVADLLAHSQLQPTQVTAIGAHGQTVRHRPQEFDSTGYTLQLNQPALLAELCGIDVVGDFRSRDVAAGGQGAPLVPPFHRAVFGHPSHARAVLNIGGISNITLLPGAQTSTDAPLIGFDCGPGNALMDTWCQLHTGAAFDDRGHWGATGVIHAGLLAALQNDAFFTKPPPKSTGRDLFHMPWLRQRLQGFEGITAQDVQATLTELTAWACVRALQWAPQTCDMLVVCGGGAHNDALMQRLQAAMGASPVCSSAALGVAPTDVEALAFAWLAQQTVLRKKSSLPSVTGAQGARILGAIYPA
ncbi:MAG: anhydro-N-acetylmuramic acid kinase [Betaproteobacteria bacterium]